MYNLLL